MKTIKVKVTLGHIALGKKADDERCPIALAFESIGVRAMVGQTIMRLNNHKIEPQIPECAEFVKAFDNGRPVSPFEFHVEVPDDFLPTPQTKTKQ